MNLQHELTDCKLGYKVKIYKEDLDEQMCALFEFFVFSL